MRRFVSDMIQSSAVRQLCVVLALACSAVAIGQSLAPSVAMAQEEVAGEGAAAPKQEESFVWFVIEKSGLIGAVLLCLSIYFVSTTIRLFLELRPQVVAPPEIVDEVEDLLQKRQFKEIYAVVKDDDSLYSKALATGISELPSGLSEARENMERVGEVVTVEMEKKISMLAVLGTLGPMIGLLGTLKGMIVSFTAIAMAEGGQIKANEVAGGISEALLITFEGVALSVPAIYFYAVFRNRVSHLTVDTMLKADEFLRHFAHAARSKAPVAPAATAAPAAVTKPAKT